MIVIFCRGADWKGRDCSDFNPETYPGRKPTNFDKKYDCKYKVSSVTISIQ